MIMNAIILLAIIMNAIILLTIIMNAPIIQYNPILFLYVQPKLVARHRHLL